MFVRTRCQAGFCLALLGTSFTNSDRHIHLTKIKCILNWWRAPNAKWGTNKKRIGKIATGMNENRHLNFRKSKICDFRIRFDCSADAGAKLPVQRVHPAISAGHTTNLNLFAIAIFFLHFRCGCLAALNFLNRTILPIRVYDAQWITSIAHTHTHSSAVCWYWNGFSISMRRSFGDCIALLCCWSAASYGIVCVRLCTPFSIHYLNFN